MLILSSKDIESIFDFKKAIEALKDAFVSYSKGEAMNPFRSTLKIDEENQFLFMPSYMKGIEKMSIKIVSYFSKNLRIGLPLIFGSVLLFDGKNGRLEALLEGTIITKLRTASVSALATEYLARKDSEILGIFGSGAQAESHALAITNVREIKRIKVYSRNEKRAKKFCEFIEKSLSIKTEYASPNEVASCDIIVTATTSPVPVFDGKLLRKGAHINAIGSFRPETREIDDDAIIRCNKIVVESREAALFEAGDLIIPIKKGLLNENSIIEIGEILTGKKKGRENADEITLFKSVGLAIEDLAIANYLYNEAIRKNIGKNVDIFYYEKFG